MAAKTQSLMRRISAFTPNDLENLHQPGTGSSVAEAKKVWQSVLTQIQRMQQWNWANLPENSNVNAQKEFNKVINLFDDIANFAPTTLTRQQADTERARLLNEVADVAKGISLIIRTMGCLPEESRTK
jgi:predicted membrane chloride channel (bestrophin family)